ncbi:MAG: V-type ATPase subunit [Candidatus Promineifilaceae bacterium]
MSDFDYANARLRAMKSRLLSVETMMALSDQSDLPTLLNALTRTPYREAVELAMIRYEGVRVLTQTLQVDMNGRIKKIQNFFTDKSAESVQLVLLRYDVDNVKAILRGLSQQLAADDILAATISQGALDSAALNELAQATNTRTAIDLLATWRVPISTPLVALRIEQPGAALWQMEMALEQWYFQEVTASQSKAGTALKEYLNLYADSANIMTVLRLVGLEGRAAFFRERFGANDPLPLLLGPGRLPFGLLIEAVRAETVQEVVAVLAPTLYGPILEPALVDYRSTGRLSSFERALHKMRLRQAVSFFVRDPHGIGVFLGYLLLNSNEVANLLRIGQGIYLRRPKAEIQADLLFADL